MIHDCESRRLSRVVVNSRSKQVFELFHLPPHDTRVQRTQAGAMSNPYFGYQGFRSAGQIIAPSLKPGAHINTDQNACIVALGKVAEIDKEQPPIHARRVVNDRAYLHACIISMIVGALRCIPSLLGARFVTWIILVRTMVVRCWHDNYAAPLSRNTPHT